MCHDPPLHVQLTGSLNPANEFVNANIMAYKVKITAEMPLVYFSVIFILTTCLSCMISAVAFGYPMILTSLEKIAALNTTALQDTGTLYWGIFAFARFFCTILSLKLSSAQIIGFGIFVLLCAGALQLVHDLQSHTMICVMSGLVAFGASCIYPTTFLYLHQYIPISAKMMAILFIAGYLAEMVCNFQTRCFAIYGLCNVFMCILCVNKSKLNE
nr:uncharacterized protein LOC107446233 [Parasteatoda tepidariorum]